MSPQPDETLESILAAACRDLELGRITAADYRCQTALRVFGPRPEIQAILSDIAQFLGFDRGNFNLALHGPAPDPAHPRFLLIKAWSCGFWSDMNHVMGCLLLAEITGRVPVVYWGDESLFSDKKGEAFQRFWSPVSPYTIEDVSAAAKDGVFPPKWTPDNLTEPFNNKFYGEWARLGGISFFNRPERVAVNDFYCGIIDLLPWIPPRHPLAGMPVDAMYRFLANRYLRPAQVVLDRVEAFAAEHFTGRSVLAVHMRGTDKSVEDANLSQLNRMYLKVLREESPTTWFFLMSDDQRLVDELKASDLGPRIITTNPQRGSDEKGLHYSHKPDPVELGIEVMVDVFLALRCGAFLGYAWSNVSDMIAILKAWPPRTCRLFGQSILRSQSLMIYSDTL